MTLSKEELSGLVEKVRGLKGPDREVDEALMAIVYTRDERHIGAEEGDDFGGWEPVKDSVWVDPKTDRWVSTSAFYFTSSVDAIRALTDRLLDGEDGRPLLYGRASEWAAMALPEHQYTETLNFAVGEAPALRMLTVSERAETECAAALLALLLSLQSQEPTL